MNSLLRTFFLDLVAKRAFFFALSLALSMVFIAGSSSFSHASQSSGQGRSEVKFEKRKISVGNAELLVEVAETPEQTSQGLMFRNELKDGEGMLFIFEREQTLSFWMKNTFIPLSIGFFNSEGKLVDIQDMKPMRSVMQTEFPNYTSKQPARFALEVPQGWFSRKNVELGARLKGEGLPLVKESRRK